MSGKIWMKSGVTTVTAILAGSVFGCTLHDASYFKKNEVVNVEFLHPDTLCKDSTSDEHLKSLIPSLRTSYQAVFKINPCSGEKITLPSALPALAIAGIGLGVDQLLKYGSGKLKDEADKHAADFSGSVLVDDFWQKYNIPKYRVLHVARNASKQKEVSPSLCYEFFLGLSIDDSNDFMWIYPLWFDTRCAKPKVSGKGKLATKTEVSFDSVWVSADGVFHKQNLGKYPAVTFDQYPLGPHKPFASDSSEGNTGFPKESASRFPLAKVPVTNAFANDTSMHAGKGYLSVDVVVTEVDHSKIKKNLTKLSEELDKNRDKIVGGVKDQLK